ncbi:MAG TPA: hypothetical protein VKD90_10945, partial [Gemmataceae bacterium]|nr:hypothetical protein [Gemmataceae bacterium]
MAKKVDLEATYRDYAARCAEAAQAETDHNYTRMLARAEPTVPLLGEAITYLRRYQKVEAPRLLSVELILRYAPPLFARRALDAVDEWYAQASRTDRKAYSDLPEKVLTTRRLLALAARLWPSWRAGPVAAAGADLAKVAQLLDFWTTYGAVVRRGSTTAPAYELVTHPKRQARGKCARCGHQKEAKWAELL